MLIVSATTSAGSVAPRQYGGAGIMVNEQDPLLGFPSGLKFHPFAFFRNIASKARTIHSTVYFMEGRAAKGVALPDLTLAPSHDSVIRVVVNILERPGAGLLEIAPSIIRK
jgi:hypothetical protein